MDNSMPIITIITATYKNFDKVFDTIKSVFEQNYSNIEYIICDDGSDNFPQKEIDDYIENNKSKNIKNISIFHSVTNRGTVKNLNNAYKKSKGEYIINLSCGDVFYSNDVVSKIYRVFIDKKSDVVVTSRILYKDNYKSICLLPHYEDRKKILKFDTSLKQYVAFITSQSYHMASGSAMHFSRKILEKYNFFDERFVLWEDGPFLSKYLWHGKIEFAYDIISLWYECGGVSTGHLKKMSPLLKDDTYKFFSEDVFNNFHDLSYFVRRKIRFNSRRVKSKNIYDKLITALFFFPETISHIIYVKHLRSAEKQDVEYLKRI